MGVVNESLNNIERLKDLLFEEEDEQNLEYERLTDHLLDHLTDDLSDVIDGYEDDIDAKYGLENLEKFVKTPFKRTAGRPLQNIHMKKTARLPSDSGDTADEEPPPLHPSGRRQTRLRSIVDGVSEWLPTGSKRKAAYKLDFITETTVKKRDTRWPRGYDVKRRSTHKVTPFLAVQELLHNPRVTPFLAVQELLHNQRVTPFLAMQELPSQPTSDSFLGNAITSSQPTSDSFLGSARTSSQPTSDSFLGSARTSSQPTSDSFLGNARTSSQPTSDSFLGSARTSSQPTSDSFLGNARTSSQRTSDSFLGSARTSFTTHE